MFPVELIPELREQIVSYLGVWQFIPLSLTCHQALQAVEAYSRRELDRIEREHNVDDTWRFRVGMQAAQEGVARLASEGVQRLEGMMLVPSNVSHRRMLRSAYRTHLYSLGRTPSREWDRLCALAVHPNGKHLLTGTIGFSAGVRLWDLSMKQCIKSFIGHESSVGNVGFSAGHVVSSSILSEKLRIWSMDGVCKHVVSLSEGRPVCTLALSNDVAYAMGSTGPIYSVNTIAGTMSSMEMPWGDIAADLVDLRVCKSYLLCMRSWSRDVDDNECRQNCLGIYIFDRDSMDIQSYLVGNCRSMSSTSEGNVAITTRTVRGQIHGQIQGQIRVYEVRDGSLVPRLSVSCPGGHTQVLCMTKTSIFVKDALRDSTPQSRISVYSSTNGVLERTLCYPDADYAAEWSFFPLAVVSDEREVFVGIRVGVGGTVKAFLR